ncbi:DNA cytosine methyltransferase [Microbispora bryophytorum]|uniref:DNA cytosine methyltransferase n=1 Tax=Microbispora bryophytorum TaxID=1460882 RepID=UPI0034075ACF
MTTRPRLLDLFCCAGGATRGYQDAGFHVTGVDIRAQPHYIGDDFHQGDAIEFVRKHGHAFDVIHASPPCQAHTPAQRIQNRPHPDLIAPVRHALQAADKPYVIENVPGAPLRNPLILCGTMFGLRTYRHRGFEVTPGLLIPAPAHPAHTAPLAKMGRPVGEGEFMHIVGNFSGVPLARQIMGMPWATRDELREAIPPAYTRYLGRHLLTALNGAVVGAVPLQLPLPGLLTVGARS